MEHNLHALSWRISLGTESKDILYSLGVVQYYFNMPLIRIFRDVQTLCGRGCGRVRAVK